jgi:hydroxymethylpyrimidine pyrophosphatase-like HAD family hydrolase
MSQRTAQPFAKLASPVTFIVSQCASRASFGGVIDIGASGLHKGDAVSWLMAQWGIGRQDAVAFGDDLPDLPLFELCAHRVAMSDGHPTLVAAATRIAPSVEADGVAHVLRAMGMIP